MQWTLGSAYENASISKRNGAVYHLPTSHLYFLFTFN